MSIIEIKEVDRAGARLVFAFGGESGAGKTLTALYFGYGLANYNAKKLGFLDCDNRRGRLYAKKLPNQEKFWIADLTPPYSPERFIEAIEAFQTAGVEVLVIDPASYEWDGIGGCLDIFRTLTTNADKWGIIKPRHSAFVKFMLQSPMHIICCLRAKEKTKIEKVWNEEKKKNENKYTSMGVQVIQEKNFKFELTASLLLHDEGQQQTILKCPGELKPFLGRGTGYITAEDGKAVRDWIDAGGTLDPEIDRWRDICINTADKGVGELGKIWKTVPPKIQKELGKAFIDSQKETALAYENKRKETTGNSTVNQINAGTLGRDDSKGFTVAPEESDDEDQLM